MPTYRRYIDVPLENIGNKIDKLIKYKHTANIYIKGNKISVPIELMDSFDLHVGKVLNKEEFDKLEFAISCYPYITYASRLLSKKLFTEYKLREKLKKKEASKEEISYVVNVLKSKGYLNEEKVISEYVDIYDSRNYGKNKIKAKLIENGANLKQINNICFDDELELLKAKSLISSLNRRYERYSYNKKKEMIYNTLISKGYDSHIASELMNQINKDEEVESRNLKTTMNIYINKYKDIKNIDIFRNKVISSCLNKGYNYGDIDKCLEEYLNEVY